MICVSCIIEEKPKGPILTSSFPLSSPRQSDSVISLSVRDNWRGIRFRVCSFIQIHTHALYRNYNMGHVVTLTLRLW